MSLVPILGGQFSLSFPRVSGDEPVARLAAITRYGFSPRERG